MKLLHGGNIYDEKIQKINDKAGEELLDFSAGKKKKGKETRVNANSENAATVICVW